MQAAILLRGRQSALWTLPFGPTCSACVLLVPFGAPSLIRQHLLHRPSAFVWSQKCFFFMMINANPFKPSMRWLYRSERLLKGHNPSLGTKKPWTTRTRKMCRFILRIYCQAYRQRAMRSAILGLFLTCFGLMGLD